MKKVIILCTGNSCRSQMAEGFLRKMAGAKAEIYSAGIEAHGLNPRAVSTMREAGIDISQHTSNVIDEYAGMEFDYVITVCDHANDNCPYLPAKIKRLHQSFPDPAKATGNEEEIQERFRDVRQKIEEFCTDFVGRSLS